VRSFAENLGFEYLTASNKEEFEATYARFVTEELTDKPMLFEIFAETGSEVKNLDAVRHIKSTNAPMMERITDTAKAGVKAFLKKIK